ncbi:glycosyltransferase [Chachezhania sediminis]|uniref:glycosyltransferase n=1 Tax=Chachezhania sediminis TaxID=2599291 RepID=UPI00131C3B94|nr:glycosyltransferase [Chachezhania sediminis]
MKVLFLTVRADLGGGPEHLYQLLANHPEGAEIWVGCPRDEPYFSRYAELLGADRIVEIPHRKFTRSALFRLAGLVRSEGIEVVHSHGKGAGLYGRLLAALTPARSVHTFHGLHVGEYGKAKKAVYLALERALGRLTSRAICVAETEAEAIRAVNMIPAGRLVTIVNGVVVPDGIERPALSETGPLKILAVSRYDHQKNPDLMIDVAAALKGRRAFEMVVLGTGERLEEMRARVAAEGLGDMVDLKGGVPSSRPYMRAAHVFLSSSRWEGMPLAVLEAMSEGLCPVVTDVAGNHDLVDHDRTGLLYAGADEAATLLAGLGPDRFDVLSGAARAFVEDGYSVQTMARRTYALLQEVAAHDD